MCRLCSVVCTAAEWYLRERIKHEKTRNVIQMIREMHVSNETRASVSPSRKGKRYFPLQTGRGLRIRDPAAARRHLAQIFLITVITVLSQKAFADGRPPSIVYTYSTRAGSPTRQPGKYCVAAMPLSGCHPCISFPYNLVLRSLCDSGVDIARL